MTRRLEHENGEAKAFYAGLSKASLIGIEATGYTLWFERMMDEQGHELWRGDAAEIWARSVRRQVTDTRAAEHLLDLLLTERFPRIWVPTPEERDLRQLLKHRDKLVRMLGQSPGKSTPGLCPIPFSGVQSRPQGSAMNGPAKGKDAGPPLTPRPHADGVVSLILLDSADAIIDALPDYACSPRSTVFPGPIPQRLQT